MQLNWADASPPGAECKVNLPLQLQEMSAALAYAIEGISRLDPQGRYLNVNEAYASAVGYTPAEMIGMNWQRTVHPDDLDSVMVAYEQMLKVGKVELETRGIRKNGSVFDKQLVMVSAYDDQHRFTGHYCFMKDITERKQAAIALRQSEERYRSVVTSLQEGIVLQDRSGSILECNASAERILGLTHDQILGLTSVDPHWQAIREDNSPFPGETHPAMVTLRTGKPCSGVVMGIRKPCGSLTWISINSQPLLAPGESLPYAVITSFSDITEKKQLESQFLRAQRLESIGTLASGIAHDLNNILTPILAVAQLLPRKCPDLDDSTQRLLEILQINAKRGGDLVKQVLSFARGTDGQRTTLQIGHLLTENSKIAKQTFPKSIQIETHIPTQNLWLLQADATQLHQVIMNLLVNARDAMPEGGTLTISAANGAIDETFARMHLDAHPGPYVQFTISDTGSGIAPDVLDHIFDPFFTTKEHGKGTGLGLSTSLAIIKNHGGFLDVRTQVGRGTSFTVYLPALEQGKAAETAAIAGLDGNNELILVVDDEGNIRETLKATLESHHYRVLVAQNGIEAIALYAQHPSEIATVLIDLMMPAMDGFKLIETLPKFNPQVQVIAMSGLAIHQDRAMQCGCVQAFLAKPFTTEALLSAIHAESARVKR